MKVFISYSVDDTEVVKKLAEMLRPFAEILWWKDSKTPGEEAWRTIHGWIDQSDLVLAVITGQTLKRAMAVGNEVGHAKAKGKTVVPLIAVGVKPADLGCLGGITYECIDPANPAAAALAIVGTLQKTKDEKLRQLVIIGAIVGLCFLIFGK